MYKLSKTDKPETDELKKLCEKMGECYINNQNCHSNKIVCVKKFLKPYIKDTNKMLQIKAQIYAWENSNDNVRTVSSLKLSIVSMPISIIALANTSIKNPLNLLGIVLCLIACLVAVVGIISSVRETPVIRNWLPYIITVIENKDK